MAKVYWIAFGSGNPQTYAGLAPTFISFCKFDGTTLAPPSIIEPVANQGLYAFTYTPSFSIAFIVDGATTGLTTADRYVFGGLDPIDTTDQITGMTLNAIGTTGVALGITSVALGTTNFAIGTSNYALSQTINGVVNTISGNVVTVSNQLINQGTTLVAIGNTSIALGISNFALGTTILASIGSVAVGLSALAFIGSTTSSYGTNLQDPVDLMGYLKRAQELLEGNATYAKGSGAWEMYSRGFSQLLRAKTLSNNSIGVTKS